MESHFDQLLADYRSIWKNRLLEATEQTSEAILKDAIQRELNDENSHPRIRRNKYEKFYFATIRIIESGIPNESKIRLLELHKELMESN